MTHSAAPETESDRCPRCGGGFHCGMGDAAPCPCTSLTLSAQTLAGLRQQYSGCLCLRCLAELARSDEQMLLGVAQRVVPARDFSDGR